MKTILITGASRGIGFATAKKFLEHGWRVIGTSRSGKLPTESQEIISVQLDLASPENVKKAIEEILSLKIKIDAVVNNAAIILDAHNKGIDIGKLRKTLEVGLINTIDFTEQLLPIMQNRGSIVNINSLYGAMSFPIDEDSSHSYRIAKAALNMYARILAYRLKDQEVKVFSLDPGWVATDMGSAVATATEKPDRKPEDAAEDIYNLITQKKESGFFWRFGKKREW